MSIYLPKSKNKAAPFVFFSKLPETLGHESHLSHKGRIEPIHVLIQTNPSDADCDNLHGTHNYKVSERITL